MSDGGLGGLGGRFCRRSEGIVVAVLLGLGYLLGTIE